MVTYILAIEIIAPIALIKLIYRLIKSKDIQYRFVNMLPSKETDFVVGYFVVGYFVVHSCCKKKVL